jgi:hypothetical protein
MKKMSEACIDRMQAAATMAPPVNATLPLSPDLLSFAFFADKGLPWS